MVSTVAGAASGSGRGGGLFESSELSLAGSAYLPVSPPTHYYTGITANVRRRLAEHNAGGCRHTSRWRPWRIVVVVAFASETRARIRAIPENRLGLRIRSASF